MWLRCQKTNLKLRLQLVVTLTDGADYAGVARCDWLLVNVQQTQMLQEGVGHAGVQLLLLDERVRQCHHLRVSSVASCSYRETSTG